MEIAESSLGLQSRLDMRWFRRKQIDLETELYATDPDYVVYVPTSLKKRKTTDTGNEHFLVFKDPDDSYMAVWTQSSAEGAKNQRIVFSKASNDGKTWCVPKVIAGPKPPKTGNMASWGFPIVSKNGRIYVIYSQHVGIHDSFFHTTGILTGIYSDDKGKSWSDPQLVSCPRSIYDNPDEKYPTNIIVWQKPLRLVDDKYYCGFTRWVSKAVRNNPRQNHWTAMESVVEFMRFENIDEDPEVVDLEISYLMSNEDALKVPHIEYERVSVVQEPSIVKLPDKRLFCVMRTTTGSPYYTISDEKGEHWQEPKPLRFRDGGVKILHPLSPCPIFQISETEFFLLFHNHDGHYKQYTPKDTKYHRRPIYILQGEYSADSKQPITFGKPRFLFDHTGRGLGPQKRHDLAMYASFTQIGGKNILWYPDRKFFLLGKEIERKTQSLDR